MSTEALFDENNNSGVDLNSVKLLEFQAAVRDDEISDSSNISESGSNQAYSVSTTSFPPDDPDREVFSEKLLLLEDTQLTTEEAVPKLRCKVKKLEAEVDSLKNQLNRINIREDSSVIVGSNIVSPAGGDERSRQEREKCVVFKCIPQAHVANGLIITRVSEFFKIPSDEITVQVTDQLNKWCVVVLQTPSRLHSSTILKKFCEFRKLYHCYHRTQALPCFSNSERQQYQQLWAEAIERNNQAGYRSWEVDPQEMRLVETVGIPQKWRVKVHYFPENDSPSASTSAIEVRRRQRGLQFPKLVEKQLSPNSSEDCQIPRQKQQQIIERQNKQQQQQQNRDCQIPRQKQQQITERQNKQQQQQNRGDNKKRQNYQQRNNNNNRSNRKQHYNNNNNNGNSGYEYLDCIPTYVPHHPHHHQYVTSLGQFQNQYYVPNPHIYNSMQFYSQHLPLDSTATTTSTTAAAAGTTTSASGNVYIITPNGLSTTSTNA
uniref:Uncharacterized protein n=1 Tax=Panagrolaimus sp. PS1159 TaxID=55785 RepID=A0AC35F0P5_9BILA